MKKRIVLLSLMLAMVVTFGACGKEQAAEEVAEEAAAEVEAEVSEGATKEAKADTKDNKKDSKSDKKSEEKKSDEKDKKDESDKSKKDEKKADKKSSEDEKNEKKATGNVSEKASFHPAYWPEGIRCSGELPAGVWNQEHTFQKGYAPGGAERGDTSTYDERVDVDDTTYRIYHHVVVTNRESTCPYCGAVKTYRDQDWWESYDEYHYVFDYDGYVNAKNAQWDSLYNQYYTSHGGTELKAKNDALVAAQDWNQPVNEEISSTYDQLHRVELDAYDYAESNLTVTEGDYYSWVYVITEQR